MPQPADVNALADKLSAVYRDAQASIDAELAELRENPAAFRARARLEELRRRVELLLDGVDEQAAAWYSQELPQAFYAGVGFSRAELGLSEFTQVNTDAVNQLVNGLFDDLLQATRRVRRTTKQLLRKVAEERVTQGVVTGQSLQEMKAGIAELMANNGVSAVTYANGAEVELDTYAAMAVRTTTAIAYNLGTLAGAAGAGVEWFEVFDGPECIAEGSPFIAYDGLVGLVRSRYSGPVWTLRSPACPDGLTIGPHHPVLTGRGWVPAYLLAEGDQVVHDRRFRQPTGGAANAQLHDVPRIEKVFAALVELGGTLRHRPSVRNDLHGDAVFAQGEIEAVAADCELARVGDPALIEQGRESVLVTAGAEQVSLARVGGSGELFDGAGRSARSSVGRFDLALSVLRRGVLPLALDGTGRRAESHHSVGAGPASDNLAARLTREGHGHLVPLTSVTVGWYEGWVYDATTVAGLFAAGPMVVKNCGWEDHDDDDLADGSIRSSDECDSFPIAHANCRRSFGPRPDITSAEEAANGLPTAPSFVGDELPSSPELSRSEQRIAARDDRIAARAASLDARAAPEEPLLEAG